MSVWRGAPPSRRAMEALERLSLPSQAGPLPDSARIGIRRWLDARSPTAVAAAFRSAHAPIPPGATIRDEAEGILVVEGPFRASGIFLSPHPSGCAYTITPGPSLVVKAPRPLPSGSAFVRVAPAPMDMDPDGRSFMCQARLGGKPWAIVVNTPDGQGSPGARGVIAQGDIAEMTDDWHGTKFEGSATLNRSSLGAVVADIATETSTARVEAFLTDSLSVVMPASSRKASCSLSTVKGSHPSAPTLTGTGFDPKERVTIEFDGAPLSDATANESGEFGKRITIPHESAPGPHVIRATGKKSKLSAEASFRVLPGR